MKSFIKTSILAISILGAGAALAATARFGGGVSSGVSRAPSPSPTHTYSAPSRPTPAPSFNHNTQGSYSAPSRPPAYTTPSTPSNAGSLATGAVVGGLVGLAAGSAMASNDSVPAHSTGPVANGGVAQPVPAYQSSDSNTNFGFVMVILGLIGAALVAAGVILALNRPSRHVFKETPEVYTPKPKTPFNPVERFLKVQTLHSQGDRAALLPLMSGNMLGMVNQTGETRPMGIHSVVATIITQTDSLITVDYQFKDRTNDDPNEVVREIWHWVPDVFDDWVLDGITQTKA